MAQSSKIQYAFTGGEVSPNLYGRVNLDKWTIGASVMRNMYVSYRGGSSSRAGLRFVGQCLQDPGPFGTLPPPRDIDFQFNVNQGYALEFGDQIVTRAVTGAANNAGEIRLELVSTRGLMTGNTMTVSGVGGVPGINADWIIIVVDATHVDLIGSTFSGSYTSGGTTVTQAGYMRIKSNGAYVVEDANALTGITQANPGVFTYTNTNYTLQNNDWIYISGVAGMTEFNGLTWIVQDATSTTFTVTDLYGVPVDTTAFSAFSGSGTIERIYTQVSPYAAEDLPFLKFTQSADTMSLCCVNQETLREYPPYDLIRNAATDWVFTEVEFGSSIGSPTNVTSTAHASTTLSTYYGYVVTAVDAETGEESVASSRTTVQNNDISVNAGSNTINWEAVDGASNYNIYKATPSYGVDVPLGASYGYIGIAFGTEFTDTNILADYTKVPPVHNDPFARGTITGVNVTGAGTGYTQATIGYTITTSTGEGFAGTPIVVGGEFVGFLVENGGFNYMNGDTITITDSGVGAGATATLSVGPQSGTYPGCVAYYQQRRVYANTLNRPDTYFFSQPGAFKNMDISIPLTDDSAIIGAPWAQQINGIQAMQPSTTGLLMFTGNGVWLLNGGEANSAITPSNQIAQSQAYNGCHDQLPPLAVNFDTLYLQAKGSIIRDLAYNFFNNIFTGTDMTVLSSHLFNYQQMEQWGYAEEPYKLIWVVRSDGVLLSLTYLKEQDVYAWARHDTNGFFVGVCSVTEPPVDAIYTITKRYINGQWKYYSERMDNRNWQTAEDAFCVDAGLATTLTYPNATLFAAAAEGTSNITSVIVIDGGSNYSPTPVIEAISLESGNGATFSATVVGGVITAINVLTDGQDYIPGATEIRITDTTGTGAIAQAVITNYVTFTTDVNTFSAGNVGDVIRIGNNNAPVRPNGVTISGGGKAVIVDYISPTEVVANIVEPITAIVYDNPELSPVPAILDQWSLATPVMSVRGLNHLEGMEVVIVADGGVEPPQTVVNGEVTLQNEASMVTVGLPFTCQLQSLYLEAPIREGTIQGRRKNISSIVVRTDSSRGYSVGTNQSIQATEPDNANVPWTGMIPVKERNALITAGNAIPLFTGDTYVNVPSNWSEYGTVAIQSQNPMPLNVLALVVTFLEGDT